MQFGSRKPSEQWFVSLMNNGPPISDGFAAFVKGGNIKNIPGTSVMDTVIGYLEQQKKISPKLEHRVVDIVLIT